MSALFYAKIEKKELKMTGRIAKDIKTLFGKNLVSIVLFGSYARGQQKKYSDIDILVIADHLPSSRKERLSLVLLISKKYLSQGKTVSLILHTKDEIKNDFEYYNPLLLSISENYKLIYDRENFFLNLIQSIKDKIACNKIKKFADFSWEIAV
jgi:predicted nucleotidyltransferase